MDNLVNCVANWCYIHVGWCLCVNYLVMGRGYRMCVIMMLRPVIPRVCVITARRGDVSMSVWPSVKLRKLWQLHVWFSQGTTVSLEPVTGWQIHHHNYVFLVLIEWTSCQFLWYKYWILTTMDQNIILLYTGYENGFFRWCWPDSIMWWRRLLWWNSILF